MGGRKCCKEMEDIQKLVELGILFVKEGCSVHLIMEDENNYWLDVYILRRGLIFDIQILLSPNTHFIVGNINVYTFFKCKQRIYSETMHKEILGECEDVVQEVFFIVDEIMRNIKKKFNKGGKTNERS